MGEVPDYSLDWDDTDKTIIMLHVTKRLSWTQVQEAINGVNDMIRSVSHDVYTVYYLENDGGGVPTGGSPLPNLRRLMMVDLDNEQLLLFVGLNPVIRNMLDVASRLYGLRGLMTKYRFVESLDDVYAEISNHRRKRERENQE